MTWIAVDVQEDHIESLLRGDPLKGIIELIWNAIDAEADQITVVVAENALGAVKEVRVEDDGHGMTRDEAMECFSHLGGSWKRRAERSKNGLRILHGQEGKGRWKAFTLGPEVFWTTIATANGHQFRTTVSGTRKNIGGFEISESTTTKDSPGTQVRVVAEQPGPTKLLGDGAIKTLTTTLALYLRMYPDLRITYRGTPLNPRDLEKHSAEYALQIAGGHHGSATLTVIEWSDEVDTKRGLFLCDSNGVALADLKAGIRAKGYEFTAYLCWEGFREMEDRLLIAEIDDDIAPLVEVARSQMREHFRNRQDEHIQGIVQDWKDDQVYPYIADPVDEREALTRDLFDVVAVKAAPAVNAADDTVARRFSLRLLREAVETNPTTLRRVLSDVLQLPQDSLDELNRLLDHTTLTEIISASSLISRRLQFLEALEILVFDPVSKGQLRERAQLHRILASETWVFGEEYALTADDQSLTTALKAHIKLLGRDEILESGPVVDEVGKERVLDLLLARSAPQTQDRKEHLVVELKAPGVKIGSDQITQIKNYAFAVASDSRFNMTDVQWDFFVVSTDLTDFAKREAKQSQRMPGLIHDSGDGTIRVWVKTWGQIIGAAKHRHKFVQDALRYSPGSEEALSYLREVHNKYLPAGFVTRATDDAVAQGS